MSSMQRDPASSHASPRPTSAESDASATSDGPAALGSSAAPNATGPPVLPVDLRDYVDFDDERGRQIRIHATDRLAVDLWCLQPRQSTPVIHRSDEDITYTVLGGRSWFVTDQGELGLEALGSMLVPAGVVHGIDNRAPDPLILMAVSSPPAERPDDPPITNDRQAVLAAPTGTNRLRAAWEAILGVNRHTP